MLIRVTEPLNYFSEPWKLEWYAKEGKAYCNRVSKAAMKVGTRVDELIKDFKTSDNSQDVYDLHEKRYKAKGIEVDNCMAAYRKWLDVYKPKSIIPCTRLNATIEGQEVTGEPDLLVDDVLVDIKCSSKISPSYWIQVNMYKYLSALAHISMLNQINPPLVRYGKVAILRLDKVTGSFEYVVKDYNPFLVDVWCGLMKAYVYYKGEKDGVDIREGNIEEAVA